MEHLGDKLNSFTSDALTGISEIKRKRKRQSQKQHTIDGTTLAAQSDAIPMKQQQQVTANIDQVTPAGIYGFDLDRIGRGPLSGGVPFGGDSAPPPPPPIGFVPLLTDNEIPRASQHQQDDSQDLNQVTKRKQQEELEDGSSLSLYEGDTWSRLWFQRVMILTLIRLLLFIRKVYEDYSAFRLYSIIGHTGHCLISIATLLLPTIVFTIYRIARYLQIALPSVRPIEPLARPPQSTSNYGQQHKTARDLEETQSRRALMSSPTESLPKQQQRPEPSSQAEDDELATARQTPTNINEEFHDTQSEQQIQIEADRQTTSQNIDNSPEKINNDQKSQEPKLESVNINKLGNIPDKETTRIILGASEQLLHGILFIFWQLKRQVDIVGYLVERSCLWRRPKETEKQQLGRLRFSGDGLEWFQDFYAAFLAILVQVYALGNQWAGNANKVKGDSVRHMVNSISATPGLTGGNPSESPESTVSTSARVLSNFASSYILTSGGDLLIMSEILVSCMVVLSLLVAVRRQDDGPLTLGLSMLGWGSIFAARIIVIALAFVHIGWQVMLPSGLCHIVLISAWIYRIALDSHNGESDENVEHRWNPVETVVEDAPARVQQFHQDDNNRSSQQQPIPEPLTSSWSGMEHLTLMCQVITLFAIPSLFYWPIMFNLKLHARPFKYLALILSENFILIAAIWYQISSTSSTSVAQWYLLGTVGASSIVGFIFIALYIACKPSLTEYFARADEIINEAEKCGIYYEFCSRVFRMPDLTKHAFTRLMNQQEKIILTQTVKEDDDEQTMTDVQLD